jgi:hypothetical protein
VWSLQGKVVSLLDRFPCSSCSTAAAFLQKFVNKGVQWAHLDIAGSVCVGVPSNVLKLVILTVAVMLTRPRDVQQASW